MISGNFLKYNSLVSMNIVHYAIGFGSENVLVKHTFIVIGLWLFSFCEFDAFA